MRKRHNVVFRGMMVLMMVMVMLFAFADSGICESTSSYHLDELALSIDNELFSSARILLPGTADAPKQKAVEEAKRWFAEVRYPGFQPGDEDSLDASAWFFFHDQFNLGFEPVWLVYLFKQDELVCRVLLGYDGDLIDIVQAGQAFHVFDRYDERFGISFYELDFWTDSVEDKAAFSRKWMPIVESYIKKNPYYAAEKDEFYLATRSKYGMPSENDLTQEDATRIALKIIVDLGADPDSVAEREIDYVFDTTNPEKPEWRLFINFAKKAASDLEKLKGKDRVRVASPYRVILDGKTGHVIDAFIITTDMQVADHRY